MLPFRCPRRLPDAKYHMWKSMQTTSNARCKSPAPRNENAQITPEPDAHADLTRPVGITKSVSPQPPLLNRSPRFYPIRNHRTPQHKRVLTRGYWPNEPEDGFFAGLPVGVPVNRGGAGAGEVVVNNPKGGPPKLPFIGLFNPPEPDITDGIVRPTTSIWWGPP